MVSERRAQRLVRRAAIRSGRGSFGFWARRAWRRLTTAATKGDAASLAVLCAVAADGKSPRQNDAKQVIASAWASSRSLELRQVVISTRAMAAGAPALVTAALHNRLLKHWSSEDADVAPALLDDPDIDVRAGTSEAIQQARAALQAGLWDVVKKGVRHRSAKTTDPWWDDPLPRLLLANSSPPPVSSLDALWRTWLKSPHDLLWKALDSWQAPGAAAEVRDLSIVALERDAQRLAASDLRPALLDAAGREGHPIAGIVQDKILAAKDKQLVEAVCEVALTDGSLTAFCKKRKLAPADPIRRSMFFVLTGQPEQLRALDPDGSLLALAYSSADQPTRLRLQKEMLSSGGLDLVRVLVGEDRRSRIQTMADSEIRYLTEQLAARGTWEDLWQIVLDLPLVRVAQVMRLFTDGWRPRDEDSRELLSRLKMLDPRALERGIKDMHKILPLAMWQARINFQGRVNDVSFAPDAPLLAVAGTARVAGIVDLSKGRLAERYDAFTASVGRVLHVGGGSFLAGERTRIAGHECRVVRCAGRTETLARVYGSVTSLARVGASRYAAGTRAGYLLIGENGGATPTRVPVSQLDLDRLEDWPRTVASDPSGERLAVLGRSLVLADASATRVLARGYQRNVVARAVMLGPEVLATSDQSGNITLLRQSRNTLRQVANTSVAGLGGIASLGSRKQVVVVTRSGDLQFHDDATLAVAGRLAGPGDGQATSLHASARGEFLAVGNDSGFTDVYDLRVGDVPALVSRPLASMVPAHLGVLTAARRAQAVSGPPGAVLDVLQACLEHRFRFDIEISDTVTLATGEYEIALA